MDPLCPPLARAILSAFLTIVSASRVSEAIAQEATGNPDEAHERVMVDKLYPAATKCAACHPRHYREWSVSPHAYAQMSPVFNAMHGTILKRTNGTNGDFCIRCHTPVGMNLGEPLFMTNIDRNPTSREGVTCIVCHRVNKDYGKISGRLAIVTGDIYEPVYGPTGNKELKTCLENKSKCRVNETRGKRGRAIHGDVNHFFQLTRPGFCGSCHDVTLRNGFRLEDAFSEYKHSPAAAKGTTCNDCHMGKIPGVVSGYHEGSAATVGSGRNKFETAPRKLTDHMFVGPDYSVIHPGIFPHNTDAQQRATIRQWLEFEWRDPMTKNQQWWGTKEFEGKVKASPDAYDFPRHWKSRTRRVKARGIINDQLALLKEIEEKRLQILQAGYKLDEIVTLRDGSGGIEFKVKVSNGTDGHNVPTGFDAERLVWLRVTVRDAAGKAIFKSGDYDPNGDVRDLHSLYVHNHELPLDKYLFSLQTRFVTRNLRGGEREQVIPINVSVDPLPFLRPEARATTIYGRPRGARKHKQTIPPGKSRWARYKVEEEEMTGRGPYTAKVELVAAMVPVNLLHDIKDVGFDYGMSAKEVGDAVVEGHQIIWEKEHVFGAYSEQTAKE